MLEQRQQHQPNWFGFFINTHTLHLEFDGIKVDRSTVWDANDADNAVWAAFYCRVDASANAVVADVVVVVVALTGAIGQLHVLNSIGIHLFVIKKRKE